MNRIHSFVTSRTISNGIRLLGASAIVVGLSCLPIAVAGSSNVPAPVLTIDPSSYVVSPSGLVNITGTTTNSTTCSVKAASFTGTPHVPVLPINPRCVSAKKPVKFSFQVAMPPNSGLTGAKDTLSFSAKGPGGKVTKIVKVDVEAYSWSLTQQPTGSTAQLDSASCSTATACVAAGSKGLLISFNGTAVSDVDADGQNTVTAVSCVPGLPVFCAAVDNVGQVLTYDGTKWSTATVVGGPGVSSTPITVVGSFNEGPALSTVSCKVRGTSQADKFCVVADIAGDVTTIDFVSGQPPSVSKSITTGLKGQTFADCATSSSCVVADINGDGIFYNGQSWTTPSSIEPRGEVTDLSCSSDGACVVTDASGGVTSFSMQQCSTSAPCLRETPTTASLQSASCVSGLCVIVASDGSVYQQTFVAGSLIRKGWDGTVKGIIGRSDEPSAVSCSLDSLSPLNLGCSIFTNGSASTSGKEYVGHVSLLK